MQRTREGGCSEEWGEVPCTRVIYRARDERQKMEGKLYGMRGPEEGLLFPIRVEPVWHYAHSLDKTEKMLTQKNHLIYPFTHHNIES